jgi:hypothetical protein
MKSLSAGDAKYNCARFIDTTRAAPVVIVFALPAFFIPSSEESELSSEKSERLKTVVRKKEAA